MAIQVQRLRRDLPGLRRQATEALDRRLTIYESGFAAALTQAGLTEEALAVYIHAGLPDLMGPSFRTKAMFVNQYLQMIALMRMHGDAAEAQRHLDLIAPYIETILRHGGRTAGLRIASARAHVLGGRNELALEQLRLMVEAMDSPYVSASTVESDLIFAGLRKDPRFIAQIKVLREQQARIVARLPETFRRHGLTWKPPGRE
jgi:hypothetical protein